jgi:hypothetical protein
MTRRNERFVVDRSLVAMLVGALVFAACGSDSTPTAPTNTSSTVTENWSSVLAPAGASTRSFTVRAAGAIVVTLTGAGTTVGLGVGLPRTSGGGCRLGVAVNAEPGTTPQISTQADAGQYCVQVYDLGTVTDPMGFALKIEHP